MRINEFVNDNFIILPEDQQLSIGQQMARDGIRYSRDKENEIIRLIGEYLANNGYSEKQIRYYMNYDEDFISDVLSELPRDTNEAQVEEGVNDPHIFKAVFLAGGPGSGKSFVANKMLKGTGLKVVNSDDIYEYLMKKNELDLDPETIASPKGQEIRDRAKQLTNSRQTIYLHGRLGLIIDGTGKDVAKIASARESLRSLGYDTMMIFVNTSLDVAQERNQQRARSLKPEMVNKMWNAVQQNIMKFQQVFGAANFYVVDNSGGLEDPDRAENFANVSSAITRFIDTPPSNPAAKKWIASQQK